MRRSAVFLTLSVMLFALVACASNSVRLLYPASEPGVLPASSSKRVTVVMLEDADALLMDAVLDMEVEGASSRKSRTGRVTSVRSILTRMFFANPFHSW